MGEADPLDQDKQKHEPRPALLTRSSGDELRGAAPPPQGRPPTLLERGRPQPKRPQRAAQPGHKKALKGLPL